MKGLSIKKLAAVGAGAALVGSALAPIVSAGALELTKSDLFNENGTPNVKVVVGSNSSPSDGVWAGNIAAAIAEQARMYRSVSVSGEGASGSTPNVTELSATLVVGGTVTFSNAKTYTTGESASTVDMNSLSGSTKEIPGAELANSTFSNLSDTSETIRWNGTNYSRTFKEKIGVKADVLFDYQGNGGAADLELEIVTNDLNYVVDLGSGIPVYESTSVTTNFTDGTNDNILIPFMGESYLVREVNKASNFLRLIKGQNVTTFNQGDLIPDLPGKNASAGQTLSVRVDGIGASSGAGAYNARVTLIDEEGNELTSDVVDVGENINEALTVEGEEAIDTILYVDNITVDVSSGVGSIGVLVGTDILDLYESKGYPYDSSLTSNFPYTVDLTYSSDGNYVTKIAIYNDNKVWRNGGSGTHVEPPLYAPSSQALTSVGAAGETKASFLGNLSEGELGKDLFTVEFLGLETNESINTIRFYDHVLQYTDTGDRTHSIPMYIQISKDGDSSFEFDTRTIYYKSSSTDVSFDINRTLHGIRVLRDYNAQTDQFGFGNGIDLNVPRTGGVDINGSYFVHSSTNSTSNTGTAVLTADGNVTFSMAVITSSSASDYLESYTDDAGLTRNFLFWNDANASDYVAYNGNPVSLKGKDDVVYEYALYGDSTTTGDLYLLLNSTAVLNNSRYDADMNFHGTDINEDGNFLAVQPFNSPASHPAGSRSYYWPNHNDFGGGTSNAYYIARFGVETAGDTTSAAEATADNDTYVYIDTNPAAGNAPSLPNNNLTQPTSDVNFAWNTGDGSGSIAFSLDEDPNTTSSPGKAYNDFGSYYEVVGGEVKIQVPDNRRRPVIVVAMAGSTSEVTGGETLEVAEGETGTTNAGTQITVEEITYTASCGAGSGEAGTCVATPQNYFEPAEVPTQMVFLDNEAPSGRLVIVGGHMVNTLAADVEGIADILTATGDGSTPWLDTASGNIVVAGYTAVDTVSAARDLIDSIEAIDMMG